MFIEQTLKYIKCLFARDKASCAFLDEEFRTFFNLSWYIFLEQSLYLVYPCIDMCFDVNSLLTNGSKPTNGSLAVLLVFDLFVIWRTIRPQHPSQSYVATWLVMKGSPITSKLVCTHSLQMIMFLALLTIREDINCCIYLVLFQNLQVTEVIGITLGLKYFVLLPKGINIWHQGSLAPYACSFCVGF